MQGEEEDAKTYLLFIHAVLNNSQGIMLKSSLYPPLHPAAGGEGQLWRLSLASRMKRGLLRCELPIAGPDSHGHVLWDQVQEGGKDLVFI